MSYPMQKTVDKLRDWGGRMLFKAMTYGSQGWSNVIGGMIFKNTSKEKVTNTTAMTVSTLFACIRNVSEDVAKIPLKVYRKNGASRLELPSHPMARIVGFQPNPEMDAMSFRETMNAQAMGWGNAYAEIQRDGFGNPVALWPLRPDRVTIMREKVSRKIFYRVATKDGRTSDIWAADIFHLHGLGFDGICGYNIVQLAAQAIGSAIAMDKFAGAFFGNGMHQGGNLEHPQNLTTDAQKRLKDQLEDEYAGAEKSHQLLVLEEGMKFAPNSIDPKASQMIETRRFSVTDFCRWLRVPPHKVADLTKSSFSNIEEQNIDYVQDGLLGWIKRWEMILWQKLLTPAEQNDGIFFEHSVDGLLRGNIKGRTEAYKTFWDRGIMSINEIRSLENLNPVDGGDMHFVPINFTTLENAIKNPGRTAGNKAAGNKATGNAVIADIATRLANREIKAIESRVKFVDQGPERFKEWLDSFYSKHNAYIADAIRPLCWETKKAVCIDMLSLKPFMQMTNNPAAVLADRRDKHADYIANNLRGYYEA